MPGVLGTGQRFQSQALSGMRRASDLEQQREAQNEQLKAAETSQKIGSISAGAGTGAMVGGAVGASGAASGATTGAAATSWSGPGMAVGAVVGAAVGWLLSEVF